MKKLSIILLLTIIFGKPLYSQWNKYKFEYKIHLPKIEADIYLEYNSFSQGNSIDSTSQLSDSVQFQSTIYVLDHLKKPTVYFKIEFLDSNKNLLITHENQKWDDNSLSVQIDKKTSYIVFDSFGNNDTVLFRNHYNQMPNRIYLMSSKFNGLTIPILKCKRRLSPVEIKEIQDHIIWNEKSKVLKCKTCMLMFEI